MASLATVFTEQEKTNWLKTWMAIDITKKGLHNFVDKEICKVHARILQTACDNRRILRTSVCTNCNTAKLRKQGKCPQNLCDAVLSEIVNEHAFSKPSLKNTSAEQWGTNSWEIAKCFMSPDGYTRVTSVQDTDFNGIINLMLNCKHFSTTFSFKVAPKSNNTCLLTKAREFCKDVRHTNDCKVTDTVLQDMFATMKALLNDPISLANDQCAQDAILELIQLEHDRFNMADVYQLMQSVQESLKIEACNNMQISKAIDEMKVYMDRHKDDFNKYVETQKQAIISTTKQCIESVQKAKITDDEANYAVAVKEFQRRLIQHYHLTFSHLSISPLMQNVDKPLRVIFVKPKIYQIDTDKNRKQTKSNRIVTYKDLLFKDSKLRRTIFLQGEPGMGKTTFVAKLVQDWCSTLSGSCDQDTIFKDVETLLEIPFVMHIVLRASTDQREAFEMIKDQIIDMIYYGEERAKAYYLLQQIMSKETCLVIQDGLDEWIDPKGKLALPLMVSSHYQCAVIITTRPWRMTDERIKDSDINHLLELEGVDDPFEQSKMILCCFNTDDSYREEFENYISENSLEELVKTPMLLSLVVCSWVEGIHLNGSKCTIYALLLDCLFKKANGRTNYYDILPVPCFINTKYLQPNEPILCTLSKLAFETLFLSEKESSLIFKESKLAKYVDEKQKAFLLRSGVVTEKKSSTFINRPSTFSFIHKSVQEFFAAYYCAKNEQAIHDVVPDYLAQRISTINDMYLVFEFLCGLNIGAAYKLSRILNEHVMHVMDNDMNIETIHSHHNYDTLQQMIVSGFKEARGNGWTDSEIQLELRFFSLNLSLYRDVICGLVPDKIPYLIFKANTFYIHTLRIDDASVFKLQKIVNMCARTIEHLYVPSCHTYKTHVNDSTLHNASTCLDLTLCRCLKTTLFGGGTTYYPVDDKSILENEREARYVFRQFDEFVLFACNSLQYIYIRGSITLQPTFLHGLQKLTCIDLRCKCVGLDLSSCPNLEKIKLHGKLLTILPKALRGLKKLKYLSLGCNCDGLDLSSSPNIEEININGPVELLPNALDGLLKLKTISLKCKCQGLDLSSCRNVTEININRPVTLLPNALHGLQKLEKLSLTCKSDGLDLSSCQNLEEITITEPVVLLPNGLRCLKKIKMVSLKCKCEGLDLSSCPNIETIIITKPVLLLPKALHGLQMLTCATINCMCDGLDLSSCSNIEKIDIYEPVKLLPNALCGLQKLKCASLYCKCDGLDLSSSPNIEAININEHVTLVPNALRGLQKLKKVTLKCKCDGLDLSACPNIEEIYIAEHLTLLPNALHGLQKLQKVLLKCKCNGLDLSTCPNIEEVIIIEHVKLLPNALHGLEKLKTVKLKCKCDGLDLSSCPNIEIIDIEEPVTLLPGALRGLEKLKNGILICKCDGLDLSSCRNIETFYIHDCVRLSPDGIDHLSFYRLPFVLASFSCRWRSY